MKIQSNQTEIKRKMKSKVAKLNQRCNQSLNLKEVGDK